MKRRVRKAGAPEGSLFGRDESWAEEPTDQQILSAIARADESALRLLFERDAPWLGVRLSRRCSDPHIVVLKELTHRHARHNEVRRVLDDTGLTSVAHRKIKSPSGGMRRRVALAQALLGHPELIILDEPTAGLDPEQRLRFRELLSTLAEDRIVLLSTHQTEDVAALCQSVIVTVRGIALLQGTPAEIARVAQRKVWLAPNRDPNARLAWRTGEGMHRNIGDAPADATLVEPTIEDGHLLLVGDTIAAVAA